MDVTQDFKSPLTLEDIKYNYAQDHNFSITINDLKEVMKNPEAFRFVIKKSIAVRDKTDENTHNQTAELISSIIETASEVFYGHYKHRVCSDANRKAVRKAVDTKQKIADARALELFPAIQALEEKGLKNDNAIAVALTKSDILTPLGKKEWFSTTVTSIRKRVAKLQAPDNP